MKLPRFMTPVAWHRPPEGMLKLNIDGSFDQNSKMGGTSRKININHLLVETDSQVNAPTDGRINNEAYNDGG
ncbi:hypothetical protein KY290_037098 [Solanum tuberosum]|uniref:Uncharacterized protein n=1 Tax=Solanum tuberosum TaxID=4113 RepID=A0ABQ7TWK6_SOLTU|nr:hypothetical protein KY285_036419 [Solanum tuberosum]KAH0738393.1 hypothetical protein KY290_037098 [Solanum tuberosum]